MNMRLENLAQHIRMLRRNLGRIEAHALIRDAQFNAPLRLKARYDKILYVITNLKIERDKFNRRLDMGIFILGKS